MRISAASEYKVQRNSISRFDNVGTSAAAVLLADGSRLNPVGHRSISERQLGSIPDLQQPQARPAIDWPDSPARSMPPERGGRPVCLNAGTVRIPHPFRVPLCMANRDSRKKPAAPAAVQELAARPAGAGRRERRQRRVDGPPDVASPAAAGPTGAALEAHVGAQYLVPLLTSGEARGLPGVVVSRVQFQRSALDYPMDDVIVTGHDALGRPATLEIQAKRTVVFTAGDRVFADVVALAGRAARKPEFAGRYELAIAIARTSTRIEQHVQETLRWARTQSSR